MTALSECIANSESGRSGEAMLPTASVSGWYFSNPEAHYFGVGKIKEDQIEDIANRKGMPLEVYKKWLSSNLAD